MARFAGSTAIVVGALATRGSVHESRAATVAVNPPTSTERR